MIHRVALMLYALPNGVWFHLPRRWRMWSYHHASVAQWW